MFTMLRGLPCQGIKHLGVQLAPWGVNKYCNSNFMNKTVPIEVFPYLNKCRYLNSCK